MTKSYPCATALIVLGATTSLAIAGDRLAVHTELSSIESSWPNAAFSVDVNGPSKEGDALIGEPVRVEYEAATPGFVTYLLVSSHGDISLQLPAGKEAATQGTDTLLVAPPLGTEEVVALFSSAPLGTMLSDNAQSANLGSDKAAAEQLVRKLSAARGSGVKIALRRFSYTVSAPAGGTEYTTRNIIFRVQEGPRANPKSGTARPTVTIPSRVQFEFDSDRLTQRGRQDLDVFGEALVTQLRNRTVLLEGHTDAIGSDDYNMDLSQRRARAVREYLSESFGLPATQLSAAGKGKDAPIAPNDSEAGRSLNRRVDFVFSDAAH